MTPRFITLLLASSLLASSTLVAPATLATASEPAHGAPKADTAAAPPALDPQLNIPFTKYKLSNGLEVILHQDDSLPLVAVNIWYHVGPVNEPPGRSGFAHLFEHLMFEGSRHAGRRFDTLMESVGATNVNATTSWDRTNYFETVPSANLELALWLESDRMGFMLDGITQERLDVQRGVVKNERRQSYENQPYGPSSLALYDTLFPLGHPYHGAIIGSMEDLDRASLDDVKQFFRDYYAPSNATLLIAGDFDDAQARKLIEHYFQSLPSQPRPMVQHAPTPPLAVAPDLKKSESVDLAKVTLAWLTPPAFSKTEPALELATTILAGGKSSRLYQSLIVNQRIASDVSASVDANALCSEVEIAAQVTSGVSPEKVEQAINQTLRELASKGPTVAELQRAKKRQEVDLKSSLQMLNGPGGESGRAGILQRLNHYLGDPGRLAAEWQRTELVSTDDVKRVVSDQLRLDQRALMVTLPQVAPASAKGKEPKGQEKAQ